MSGDVTALVAQLERDFPPCPSTGGEWPDGRRCFIREHYEERVSIKHESRSIRPEWESYLLECQRLGVRAPGQLELTGRAACT